MPVLLFTRQVKWIMPFQCPLLSSKGESDHADIAPLLNTSAGFMLCNLAHTPWIELLARGPDKWINACSLLLHNTLFPFSNGTKQNLSRGGVSSLLCLRKYIEHWTSKHRALSHFFTALAVSLGKGIKVRTGGCWHLCTLFLLAFSCYPKPPIFSNGPCRWRNWGWVSWGFQSFTVVSSRNIFCTRQI